MRRCPNCNRIYPSSETSRFCIYDGTSLLTPGETAEAPTLQDNIGDYPTLELKEAPKVDLAASEKAKQLSLKLELKEVRSSLYGLSDEAVKYAKEALVALIKGMEEQAKAITEIHPRVKVEFRPIENNAATIFSGRYGVRISWWQPYTNTIDEAELTLLEQIRSPRFGGQPTDLYETAFAFDIDTDFQMGWRDKDEGRFVSSEKLAGECLERLMNLLSRDES